MKTIMRNTKLVMILAFLPALLSAAQAQAVDYKGTYKGSRVQKTVDVTTTTTTPTVSFQSTSVMPVSAGVGTSTLNEDGTVNAEAYGVGANRPGMRKNSSVNPGTPTDDDEEEEEQQPLGDGLIALMLLACAYLIVRATRKEEKIG